MKRNGSMPVDRFDVEIVDFAGELAAHAAQDVVRPGGERAAAKFELGGADPQAFRGAKAKRADDVRFTFVAHHLRPELAHA